MADKKAMSAKIRQPGRRKFIQRSGVVAAGLMGGLSSGTGGVRGMR